MAEEMFKTTLMGGFDKDDVLAKVKNIKDEAYAEKSKLIKAGKEKDKKIKALQDQINQNNIRKAQEMDELRAEHRQELKKMEKLLEDGINAIGLGPQGMGGKYSVMGVNIENTARHPSTIGVAVNVGCWSHRRGHLIVNSDLTVTCDTHSTWKFNA